MTRYWVSISLEIDADSELDAWAIADVHVSQRINSGEIVTPDAIHNAFTNEDAEEADVFEDEDEPHECKQHGCTTLIEPEFAYCEKHAWP